MQRGQREGRGRVGVGQATTPTQAASNWLLGSCGCCKERETDRQTDRQTDRVRVRDRQRQKEREREYLITLECRRTAKIVIKVLLLVSIPSTNKHLSAT